MLRGVVAPFLPLPLPLTLTLSLTLQRVLGPDPVRRGTASKPRAL